MKTGSPLDSLLANLPPGMEFVPQGRQGTVTVGRVRYREAPVVLLPRRVTELSWIPRYSRFA